MKINKKFKLLRESTKFIYVAHDLPPGERVFHLSSQYNPQDLGSRGFLIIGSFNLKESLCHHDDYGENVKEHICKHKFSLSNSKICSFIHVDHIWLAKQVKYSCPNSKVNLFWWPEKVSIAVLSYLFHTLLFFQYILMFNISG